MSLGLDFSFLILLVTLSGAYVFLLTLEKFQPWFLQILPVLCSCFLMSLFLISLKKNHFIYFLEKREGR